MTFESSSSRLCWLITRLAADVGLDVSIPGDEAGKRRLLRALMNVREPEQPVSAEFLAVQDEELQCQLREKGVVRPEGDGITLWQGDITRLDVDAIVNAANSKLLGCFVPLHGCIDNAIHSAAGIQLRMECAELMRRQGHDEASGQAKMTSGYNLPARHVIHTVGPIVYAAEPTAADCLLLADCYRSCLALADKSRLRSIAFCCISTGEFRFPHHRAAEIAIGEVRRFMAGARNIRQVVFNVFKDEDKTIYQQLLSEPDRHR